MCFSFIIIYFNVWFAHHLEMKVVYLTILSKSILWSTTGISLIMTSENYSDDDLLDLKRHETVADALSPYDPGSYCAY